MSVYMVLKQDSLDTGAMSSKKAKPSAKARAQRKRSLSTSAASSPTMKRPATCTSPSKSKMTRIPDTVRSKWVAHWVKNERKTTLSVTPNGRNSRLYHGLMKMFENEGYDTGDVIVVKDQTKAKLAA